VILTVKLVSCNRVQELIKITLNDREGDYKFGRCNKGCALKTL